MPVYCVAPLSGIPHRFYYIKVHLKRLKMLTYHNRGQKTEDRGQGDMNKTEHNMICN